MIENKHKGKDGVVKIAYFGDDFFINCFYMLREFGHEIAYVFVCAEEGYGDKLLALANAENIPIRFDKVEAGFVDKIICEDKIDCVFSAGYGWKIKFDYDAVMSVNVHPTLLPMGRGPDAAAWVTLKYRESAGVTFHKLNGVFDAGDILCQRSIVLEEQDGWEMYMAKVQIEVAWALPELLENISELYEKAMSQESGVNWPPATIAERLIDWDMTQDKIRTITKAFGRWGVIALVGDTYLLINDLELSTYSHSFPVGKPLNEDRYAFTIATKEGLALLAKKNILRTLDVTEARNLGLSIGH